MIKESIKSDEFEFPFIVRKPKNFKEGLPLIIQLHGAGERGDGTNLDAVELHGFTNKVFTDNAELDCLLVMPQCPCNSFWAAQIPYIHSFILKTAKKYKCDMKRIYLTGLSMGGYGTWYTSMAFPDMFAAIAPCCGGGMPWNASVLKMPVWAFHGEKDSTVFVTESINMVEAIKENGGNVNFTVFSECGHNSWDYAYTKELFDWLMTYRINN